MVTEEDAPELVSVARQTKIISMSEGILLVATDARWLVWIGSLVEWDGTQACTTASDIIDALPARPFTVIIASPTIALLYFRKNLRFATAHHPPSAIIRNKCDEASQTLSNLPLFKNA